MAELHHVERIFRAPASGGIARTVEVAVCLYVCPQVQMRGDTGRKAHGLCSGSALLILDSDSRAANLFGNRPAPLWYYWYAGTALHTRCFH